MDLTQTNKTSKRRKFGTEATNDSSLSLTGKTPIGQPSSVRPVSAITATTTANVTHRHGLSQIIPSSSASVLMNSSSSASASPSPSPFNNVTKKDIKANEFRIRKSNKIVGTVAIGDKNQVQHEINSDELNFLYKLYVPNKYLIKNNKKSLQHLLNHLPAVVPIPPKKDIGARKDPGNDLNLQIHLFLSTIMIKYVNSWYLGKLNTDNFEFVSLVYQLMCDFVKDLAERVNKIVAEDFNSLILLDDLASILNEHVIELKCDERCEYPYKFLQDYYSQSNITNCLAFDPSKPHEDVIKEYIQSKHIIFGDMNCDSDDTSTSDDKGMEPSRQYFRVLFGKILQETFSSERYSQDPVSSSKIATELVTLIMSDIVLIKVFEKLSSPEFILQKFINELLFSNLDRSIKERKSGVKEKVSLINRAKSILYGTYQRVSDLIINISNGGRTLMQDTSSEEKLTSFDVFDNSIIDVFNTITKFASRKPLFSSMLTGIRTLVSSHEKFHTQINNLSSRYLSSKIISILSEERICKVIGDLRMDVFYSNDNKNETEAEKEHPSIDEIADNISIPIGLALSTRLPGYLASLSLKYQDETENQQRESIKRFLSIFASENVKEPMQAPSRLNKLLIIKLLDCIIAHKPPFYFLFNEQPVMLPIRSSLVKASCQASQQLIPKRQFLGTAASAILGSFLFSKNNELASKMENGELHYEDPNAKFNKGVEPKPLFTRREPEYPGHVPLYNYEKLLMFLGSSIGSYYHPERNEFIVALGESTAITPVLRSIQTQMLSDPVGRQILREKPRMTSTSLDLDHLRSLPENSIGRTYVEWLDREGVSPDTRVPVRYIDNEELAYIYQRYRECHDFYHAVTGLPIIIEGEIAVKVFEFMNIGMPMSGMGALFAPLRLKPNQKQRLYSVYYPWAFKSGLNSKPLMNVYWENILDRDVDEFRKEMGIEQPPDLRQMRKEYREKLKAKKAGK
ncbi:COQ4 [[Candida] subhashii]|uniref:4-hydroxy-3-methoxy-5-polyprenylbenzoate decarboxylase n=1 Tax=[Candida] subhashii TaxID=561895 RepID=A0A8J5QMW4_9ASCO|nr:COQ4 [[Candida] subhashii]KAG7661315.1 COQ4 [[Candida] subhashii]